MLFNPQLERTRGFITFPKGICPKVNIIALPEFELAYHDSTNQRFNNYTMRTTPQSQKEKKKQ